MPSFTCNDRIYGAVLNDEILIFCSIVLNFWENFSFIKQDSWKDLQTFFIFKKELSQLLLWTSWGKKLQWNFYRICPEQERIWISLRTPTFYLFLFVTLCIFRIIWLILLLLFMCLGHTNVNRTREWARQQPLSRSLSS